MSLPYQGLDGLDTRSSTSTAGGIILGSSDEWRTWFSTIKVTAQSLGTWKYLDPDTPNPEQIPSEPREPIPGDAQDGAQLVQDLATKNYEIFQRLLAQHDRQTLQFSNVQRNLYRVIYQIRQTVASDHQHLIAHIEDPRELLIALRDRFSPSETERMLELRVRWLNKTRSSPKDSRIDAWLTEWENLYAEAVCAEVPDAVDPRTAAFDFLSATRSLDEQFYFYTYQKTLKEIKKEDISFTTIVNSFRQLRATSQKEEIGRPAGFATLDGQKEAGSEKKQPPDCVCGQKHFFQSCPYLTKSARSSDWTPDPTIEQKLPGNIQKLGHFARTKAEKMYDELYPKKNVHFAANISSDEDIGLGF